MEIKSNTDFESEWNDKIWGFMCKAMERTHIGIFLSANNKEILRIVSKTSKNFSPCTMHSEIRTGKKAQPCQ